MNNQANQDRAPNFRVGGKLFLVRCFACDPKHGRENCGLSVTGGQCAWCHWREGQREEKEVQREHF